MENNVDINVNNNEFEKKVEKVELPFRDLAESKIKTDIFLNISDDDKKKLIALNSWAVKALELSVLERVQKKNMRINTGEVWSVDLGENIGTEMNKSRPCIVVSVNVFNDSNMVTVMPITNTLTDFPSQVKVEDLELADLTGTVKGEQIRTLSKARFGKRICTSSEIQNIYLLQIALMKHVDVPIEITDAFSLFMTDISFKEKFKDLLNEFQI